MSTVQETAALPPDATCSDSLERASPIEDERKENEVISLSSVENLQEGASERESEDPPNTCKKAKTEVLLTHTENQKVSEKEKVKKKTKTGQLKDGAKDSEFTAMEGELLDFEDYTHNEEGDKNNARNFEDGAADKLSEKILCDKEDGACSEGELDAEGEDLEEGELREPGSISDQGPVRQVCRFFHRGVCYFGNACRFVHLAPNNKKGNYSMFDSSTFDSTPPPPRTSHTSGFPNQHNLGVERQPPRVPEFVVETAPLVESAWEKGLREARNLLQQAHIKRRDPNHNHKKLNLSLSMNEKNIPPDLPVEEEKRSDRENFYHTKGFTHNMGYNNERREKDSRDHRQKRISVERRFSKGRNRNMGAPHNADIERPFFENFFDPWRRSKSPNRLSRERSYSSFSTYSSHTRSSHTSGSCSPSSRSSCRNSRSPSVQQKRKVSPVPETAVSPKVSSNRFGPVKKKPGPRTSSSRSRSVSRSRSRSISMDSISNSTVSHTSHTSESPEHEIKDLREKSAATIPDAAPVDNKFRGIGSILNSKRDLLEEKFEDAPVEMDLRYLIPKIPGKKEPLRLALTPKNPIKLTLLNKFPQSKAGFSKDSKEFSVKKPDEPLKLNLQGLKRPLSPSGETAEPVKQTPVLLPKKSASSRRDELLKQLKAVEDAIARKRAKF